MGEKKTPKGMKSIFAYRDFRKYLLDFYKYQKRISPKFSYRRYSRLLGVKSPGFIVNLIVKKRNIAQTSIFKLCRAFKLSGIEAMYFENLVFYNQAQCSKAKKYYSESLGTIKKLWKPGKT
jgi:uncharacterized protein (TIGR02147 family)